MHNVLKHNKIYYYKTFSIITCRQQTPRVIGASWTWDSQRTWQSTEVEERDNDAFCRTGGRFFLKPSIAVFIIPVTVLMSLSAVEAHIGQFLASVGLKNYKLDDHMA